VREVAEAEPASPTRRNLADFARSLFALSPCLTGLHILGEIQTKEIEKEKSY